MKKIEIMTPGFYRITLGLLLALVLFGCVHIHLGLRQYGDNVDGRNLEVAINNLLVPFVHSNAPKSPLVVVTALIESMYLMGELRLAHCF